VSHIKKQVDITVLRAVAVIMVLLYHFFPSTFGLGYLGVDVFLVISGYLMVASYSSSNNSFEFLVKRAYRLLPALLSVVFVTYIATYFLGRHDFLYDYFKELWSALSGISNVYYLSKIGYFDPGADNKLFLTSWSLSLEAQYYILIALTFGAIVDKKKLVIAVMAVSMMSFYFLDESTAFFVIGARLWEFGSGVMVYLYAKEQKKKMSWFLIALIPFVLVVCYKFNTDSSLLLQVLAVLFSVLVLERKLSFSALSQSIMRPLNEIGNASYSTYLVHWPVLFYAKSLGYYSEWYGVIAVFVIVIYLSFLNYQYIEIKFTNYLRRNNKLLVL